MPIPQSKQLELSESDRERLSKRIRDDFSTDSMDLQLRTEAMRRWYKLWRNGMDIQGFPEEERSNFSVPLIPWTVKAKTAKELDVLLGDESEIVVNPIGQSDVDRVEKVRRWMNWRVKHSLQLYRKLYAHILQKNIFGTSIAFVPWVTRKRIIKKMVDVEVPDVQILTEPNTGLQIPVPTTRIERQEQEREVVDFDGPDFVVENLEDWVVPANVNNPIENHFTRRLWLSLEDILDLRDQGKVDGTKIAEYMDRLRTLETETTSPSEKDAVSQEKADQSGQPTHSAQHGNRIELHCWHGKFRIGVAADNTGGDERATDIVAFYSPDLHEVLGVNRLVDIFPDGRQPFIVSRAIQDVNRPWGIGLCEILEPISKKVDAFHQLAEDAGAGAVGPAVIYEPAAGFDPEKHRLEPYVAIPTASAAGVKVIQLGQVQLAPYILLIQQLQGFAERVTSISDPQLGRQSDRPNAPRTLGQQQILQTEGNTVLLLDIRLERESLRDLLHMIWEMDKRWLSKPVFFRVTENDPMETLTDEDMQGEYDFDIGPVTMVSNRFQKTQELMQALALAQNTGIPQIVVALLKKMLERLGQGDVAALLPPLEQVKPPQRPEDENVRITQGEQVEPHPMDNHAEHVAVHTDYKRRIEMADEGLVEQGMPTLQGSNPSLFARLDSHIAKHQQAGQTGAIGLLSNLMQGGGGQQQVQGSPPNPFAQMQATNAGSLNQGSLNIA